MELDKKMSGLQYGVNGNPGIILSFVFGFQQVLLAISSTISIPLIVSEQICAGGLDLVQSEIMSTFLVMAGICTILQVLVGVRLPIIQGGCHSFIPAIAAVMAQQQWRCPSLDRGMTSNSTTSLNTTDDLVDRTEVWQSRMREIQGGIILASITQIVIGCTGFLGVILQYVGPITIVPTISLVGLSLIDVAISFCMKQWGIAALTIFLAFLFSLYLPNIPIPLPAYTRRKGFYVNRYPAFKMLPVLLAVAVSWVVCGIFTTTNVFPNDPSLPAYFTRTDARADVLKNAKWFYFPYPGQWGMPSFSVSCYMAMLTATISSIIESVSDYYACARISEAPPPPGHAVNRGIAIEGLGSIISGFLGSGGATTSYSQNVGAIGLTKVASRYAFVAAGLIFLVSGLCGKVGAILVMLPDPILGGIVVISLGMVTSVGLSTLQFVDLSSVRNICIVGSSMLIGLMIPRYLSVYPDAIKTGYAEIDKILFVLLSTAMFVGGVLGFVLDNTVPGSDVERGIITWREQMMSSEPEVFNSKNVTYHVSTYDIPFITPVLHKIGCCRFCPLSPSFNLDKTKVCRNIRQPDRHSVCVDKTANVPLDKDCQKYVLESTNV